MKDVKKELPKGWRWEKIGNHIAQSQSGLACGEKSRKEGFPHLRMNNISNDLRLDLTHLWKIPATEKEISTYSIQRGDILFNNTNSPALVGKSCLFDIESEETFLFSNHLTRIRTRSSLNSRYLLYWIGILWQRRYFEDNCDKWVNQAAIRVEDSVFSFDIPLPPTLDEQIAIANELERKMADVEAMRQAALRQKEASDALQDSTLRELFPYQKEEKLPEGWQWIELDDIFAVEKKQIDTNNPSFFVFPFIGMENIESNTRKFVPTLNDNGIGESSCYLFDERHVLYGKLRPYLNKVYLPHKPGRCAMELLPLKPKNGFTREFVASLLQTKIVIDYAVKHSTGGRMPRANINKLRKLIISIPSTHDGRVLIADKINFKMGEIEKTRLAIEKQLDAIEAMPGAILREVFDFGKN